MFELTPVPDCNNCCGTGIFSEDENGLPYEPCIFCLEEAIRNGEVDGSIGGVGTLAEFLPAQSHYFLLWDGVRYARYGMQEPDEGFPQWTPPGLLLFTSLDQVDQFVLTNPSRAEAFESQNGVVFSGFEPVRVAAADLPQVVSECDGRLCVPYRLGETVADITT